MADELSIDCVKLHPLNEAASVQLPVDDVGGDKEVDVGAEQETFVRIPVVLTDVVEFRAMSSGNYTQIVGLYQIVRILTYLELRNSPITPYERWIAQIVKSRRFSKSSSGDER